jgi:hypothetical protein
MFEMNEELSEATGEIDMVSGDCARRGVMAITGFCFFMNCPSGSDLLAWPLQSSGCFCCVNRN